MKQEKLEEASTKYANKNFSSKDIIADESWYASWLGFRNGAKWQQEQIGKSEFLQKLRATKSDAEARRLIFEQFKNK